MTMSGIDRDELGELLSAYLDGALGARDTAMVERVLRDDAAARRLLDELRRTVELVASLPRHGAPESIAEDLQQHAERGALLGDEDDVAQHAHRRRPSLARFLSMAAVLALIVGGSVWVIVGGGGMRGRRGDAVVADRGVERDAPGADDTRVAMGVPAAPDGADGARGRSRALSEAATGVGGGVAGDFADLDRKLAAGATRAVVLAHAFANEPLRLRIASGSDRGRDALAAGLAAYLGGAGVVDVRAVARDVGSEGASGPGSGASGGEGLPASFFYVGAPGVNFAEAGTRQMLVRVPAEKVEGLIARLDALQTDDMFVSLQSGPLPVLGWQDARRAMLRIARPAVAYAFEAPTVIADRGAAVGRRVGGSVGGAAVSPGGTSPAAPVSGPSAPASPSEGSASGEAAPASGEAPAGAGGDSVIGEVLALMGIDRATQRVVAAAARDEHGAGSVEAERDVVVERSGALAGGGGSGGGSAKVAGDASAAAKRRAKAAAGRPAVVKRGAKEETGALSGGTSDAEALAAAGDVEAAEGGSKRGVRGADDAAGASAAVGGGASDVVGPPSGASGDAVADAAGSGKKRARRAKRHADGGVSPDATALASGGRHRGIRPARGPDATREGPEGTREGPEGTREGSGGGDRGQRPARGPDGTREGPDGT
ncbi:MAG: anti-sigma factor family protein, partial [Phycisphaerae bacterium]